MRKEKISRVLLLLITPYILTIFFAGCVCDIQTMYYKYDFQLLELKHLESTHVRDESENTIINKNAYGIEARLDAVTVAANVSFTFPAFSIIAQANAMTKRSCLYSRYEPMDSIASIKIIAMTEADGNWKEMEDATERFRVYLYQNQLNASGYVTLEKYVKWLSYPNYNQQEKAQVSVKEQYLLMTPFANAGLYRFKVVAAMKTGKILEQITTPVYLQ